MLEETCCGLLTSSERELLPRIFSLRSWPGLGRHTVDAGLFTNKTSSLPYFLLSSYVFHVVN